MATVLITGGTGQLGRRLVPRLIQAGHSVRVSSRSAQATISGVDWAQLDLKTGAGLPAAVQGVDVIVHAASSPFRDSFAVDVLGTRRLLNEAQRARHFIYISIVGIERIPMAYYQHKLAAEQVIKEAGIPWTILRATQFHTLLDYFLSAAARLPVLFLPTDFQFQLVDTGEVADVLAQAVDAPSAGYLPDMGGPEVLRLGAIARSWLAARGIKRRVIPVPLPGWTAASFRRGDNTTPQNRQGQITWEQWLQQTYGVQQAANGLWNERMETR